MSDDQTANELEPLATELTESTVTELQEDVIPTTQEVADTEITAGTEKAVIQDDDNTSDNAPVVDEELFAAIDGPTQFIQREPLTDDMPDLSVKAVTPSNIQPTVSMDPAVADLQLDAQTTEKSKRTKFEPTTVQVQHIEPWVVLKLSGVISACLFFIWMIAVALLYLILESMGVWGKLNNTFSDMVSIAGSDAILSAGQIFGYSIVFGLINAVLFTGISTAGAFIYNQCVQLVGGFQVTVAPPAAGGLAVQEPTGSQSVTIQTPTARELSAGNNVTIRR